MKYGIKINNGHLAAITEFPNGILPDDFKEVTIEKYNELIQGNLSFAKFDIETETFVEDKEAEEAEEKFIANARTASLKQDLSFIVSELILAERLGEDTTVLQKEFDDVSKEYKASKNIPPKVYAGKRQVISLPDNKVRLLGMATDVDGEVVTVKWEKLSGLSAEIQQPEVLETEVKGLEVGTYRFRLTATDDKGDTAYSDVNIKVKPKGAIKLKVSTKGKSNVPASGELIKINVESNSEWFINTKGNAIVTPLNGVGNKEVSIQILKNETELPVTGKIELVAEDKKASFVWDQLPNKPVAIETPLVACFDLESNILLANGTSKKLKDITIGEELFSLSLKENVPFRNEAIPLEEVSEKEQSTLVYVTDFGVQTVPEFRRITLVDDTELNITEAHPLLASKNAEDVAWYMPDDLRSGMFIVNANKELIEIDSKRTINETLEIGVLQVEGSDNYIVENVIVHNVQLLRTENRPFLVNGGVNIAEGDVVNKNNFKA